MTIETMNGEWAGTCAFRMMPTDELIADESTARITNGVIEYTWTHPAEGTQTGHLALCDDRATWVDSWHQPDEATLHGAEQDGALRFEMTYAQEWGWVISLDRRSEEVIMLMHNVIPKAEATHEMTEGPYVVMEAHWRKP